MGISLNALLWLLPVILLTVWGVARGARRSPAMAGHGEWISIDYLAYASGIRHWNPLFKVVLSLSAIGLSIGLHHGGVSVAVMLTMLTLVSGIGGLSLRDYLRVLSIPLTFILLSMLAVVLSFSGHQGAGYWLPVGIGWIGTTPGQLVTGGLLTLKILAAVSGLQMMILTTPSSDIMSVIRKTRLPGELLTLMYLIYRYIFILMDTFTKMRNAAASRLGYDGLGTSWRTFGSVAGNLLVISMKKAGSYFDAMESRGYDGDLRFLEDAAPVRPVAWLGAAGFAVYLVLMSVML